MHPKILPWKNLKALTNNKIYIVGAGGFGKEVKSILNLTEYSFAGFIDDKARGEDVLGSVDHFINAIHQNSEAISIAIGSSRVRSQVHSRLPAQAYFPNIVHPSVILQQKESISMGRGCFLAAKSVFTCDITIGNFALINLNCTIGHDVIMGDFCSLMPAVNLSGNVKLGHGVFIGTGATILQGVTIGDGAIIGAGAVVTHDVPPGQTAVGIPARLLPIR